MVGSPPRKSGFPPIAPHAWRRDSGYRYLETTGRAGFAWEWLRRTPGYRAAWRDQLTGTSNPRAFGLAGWVDPALPASQARPIWHAAADPGVLDVTAIRPTLALEDALDLLPLAAWVSVAIDDAGDEHWLISDGRWSVRIDIRDTTLLGGAFEPRFALVGVGRLSRALRAIERLRALVRIGRVPLTLQPGSDRAARWIAELRTADAMAEGVRAREITQELFGIDASAASWRVEADSYRSRTRRLMRTARLRLRPPVTDYWFRS